MNTKRIILIIPVIIIAIAITSVILVLHNKHDAKQDFEITEIQQEVQKYDFLSKELSDYIVALTQELDIDPDLCIAILLQENPTFNVEATHSNNNGTIDVGLWQLNDWYLWTTFQNNYWKFKDIDLNPMNWKHSTFIAIQHIATLNKQLKVFNDVICAYNCGAGAVMNNEVPETTKEYLIRVTNNYRLLKNIQAEGDYVKSE